MNKFFAAGIASLSLLAAGSAYSADLAPYKAAPAPRPACAQFGGFYGGVQVGSATLDSRWVDRDAWVDNFGSDWAIGTVNNTKTGFTAGGQLGYNYQTGCTLFGVEVDANWTSTKFNEVYSPVAGPGTVLTLDSKLDWYGTARVRSGIIVDNVLLYTTGGLAFAGLKHNFTVTDPGDPTEAFSAKKARWGGAVGVGTEWAFAPKWSLKSEFLYIAFQPVKTSVFSPAGPETVNFTNNDSLWVSRIGVNYHW